MKKGREQLKNTRGKITWRNAIRRDKWLYIFLIPFLLYFVVFKYVPMLGAAMAFQNFKFSTGFWGSEWVGLEHFKRLLTGNSFGMILKNTLLLNIASVIFGFPIPIILAILLNEIRCQKFKKVTQSIMYLPHFMSWVVLGGILIEIFSPSTGIVNMILKNVFGIKPIYFMGSNFWWPVIFVISGIWQGAGWGTIVYLAAITGIDPELYEAAKVDGAGKLRQILHITIPGIAGTIVIMLILRMGSMMDIGFEQVYVMMNPKVREVSEVISTYVYRVGIEGAQYSYTTAIGLFQSAVSCLLVFTTNAIARRINGSGLW
ncbi:MAG: ABC transporter permease subunit [Eubacteriales bacterium]|nr:ABC transporter permease subunit [Eubacteriales bacterium]